MYNTSCACVQIRKYFAKCEYLSVNPGSVVRILKCCAKRSVNTKVGKSRWLPPSSSHLLTPLSSLIYDTSSSFQRSLDHLISSYFLVNKSQFCAHLFLPRIVNSSDSPSLILPALWPEFFFLRVPHCGLHKSWGDISNSPSCLAHPPTHCTPIKGSLYE